MYVELKDGVNELVRQQRDLCNKMANEARKVVEPFLQADIDTPFEEPKDKEERAEYEDAMRKLWLVSKGTPRNRVIKRIKEHPDLRAVLDRWDLYYYADQNKDERKEMLAQLYMTVDEKGNDYELTDKGIAAWNARSVDGHGADDFVMMDISDAYLKIDADPNLTAEQKVDAKVEVQEEDAQRKERVHNLRQLLRAHLMMEKDVDYIVHDGTIVIIDENTGRPQPGRRFSDGLHQAIEAKEGVEIQKETQTYATITLQNYFRMYDKLAGMTGTASTEANELKQIYSLDVLEIPTNKPCQRTDHNDEIYMTEREKYNAILKEVTEEHHKGRPILIGTDSVSASEVLSRVFRGAKLPHTVLNAKHHEKEAEIIAGAGKHAAITIATNMAGRGTDIKLEKGVADLGGLYVMGTTRHQSRRTDRQLRGRCARQGDPGSSKFYISFEDSLLRLFASPRITAVLQKFRPPEGEPITAGILNKSIETAQKRVEQRNYMMRKHTLEYDDVMNKQRQELYAFRNEILHAEDVTPMAIDLLETVCSQAADEFFTNRSGGDGWDPEGYRQWLMQHFPVTFKEGYFDDSSLDIGELEQRAADAIVAAFKEKLARENEKIQSNQSDRMPQKPANEAVRNLIIRKIDKQWQEHLLEMDHLRHDVNMRSVGQRDPLMEFKHEAFRLFDEFGRDVRKDIAQDLFRFEIIPQSVEALQQLLSQMRLETTRSFASELDEQPPQQAGQEQQPRPEPVVVGPKVGRNDPCPCGSGKKYKKCCGQGSEDFE